MDNLAKARAVLAEKHRIKRNADAFRIWRLAKGRGWECSLQEVAQETGMTLWRVRSICAERNWDLPDEPDSDYSMAPVDLVIAGTVVREGDPRGFATVQTPQGRRVVNRAGIYRRSQ